MLLLLLGDEFLPLLQNISFVGLPSVVALSLIRKINKFHKFEGFEPVVNFPSLI